MMKHKKSMKTLALFVGVGVFSIGANGCGGGLGQIISSLINLAGGGGAGGPLGAGGNQGVGGAEGVPPGGQAAPPPAPVGSQQRGTPPPPLPATAQEQLSEIQTKYRVTLRGSYNEQDVANTLTSLRAYPPERAFDLSFTFTAERRQQGVLGVWQNRGASGQSEIYSGLIDVVFHEFTHQVTLANQNGQTSGAVGEQVVAAAKQAGGGEIASNCITRSYARTNEPEFMAEFFTGLRSLENGLQTRFTLSGGTFNPDENVRAVARRIWAQ